MCVLQGEKLAWLLTECLSLSKVGVLLLFTSSCKIIAFREFLEDWRNVAGPVLSWRFASHAYSLISSQSSDSSMSSGRGHNEYSHGQHQRKVIVNTSAQRQKYCSNEIRCVYLTFIYALVTSCIVSALQSIMQLHSCLDFYLNSSVATATFFSYV